MSKYFSFILMYLFSMIFLACDIGDLRLSVQFKELKGLESGNRIICNGKYIGDVEEIRRSQGYHLVELDVDSDHKNKLTVYSIFYIDKDPDRAKQMAIFTEQKSPGGILLTNDSVVAGLDQPPYLNNMLDDFKNKMDEFTEGLAEKIGRSEKSHQRQSTKLSRQLENSLAEIDKKLRELERVARTSPHSKRIKELKDNIGQLVNDIETVMEQTEEKIRHDLYSNLKESLAELKERINKLNNNENRP